MDCFASLAMTARAMDCFAEPVIGRAFGATRWLAMTVSCDHRATLSGCHRPRRSLRSKRLEGVSGIAVIASAAKQSILSLRGAMDCFASLAMTARARDCFAEPVIGRAFARPVGSQ